MEIQDNEGVNFGYYFSASYTMKHQRHNKARAQTARGRGDRRGREDRGGRGERGGRGRGRGGHTAEEESTGGSKIVGDQRFSLRGQETNEKKLATIFQFLNKYIKAEFDAGKFTGKEFTFPKQ